MRNAWDDDQVIEQLALRKENWPDSVINRYEMDRLALFAIDIDECNEVYLVFNDGEEPLVISYFEYQEDK